MIKVVDYLTDPNNWYLIQPDTLIVSPGIEAKAREILEDVGSFNTPREPKTLQDTIDQEVRRLGEI